MPNTNEPLLLTADEITRLLSILRNAPSPVTTQQLVEAFKRGSAQ